MKNSIFQLLTLAALGGFLACSGAPKKTAAVDPSATKNSYDQINLVANREEFHPQKIEPDLQNAWGLANRPAGAGGHFWVANQKSGKSIQYVGDVNNVQLFQDNLPVVDLLEKKKPSTPTGVVMNPADQFVITQPSPSGPFTIGSKFLFVTDTGCIFGWAEKKNPDGSFNRPRASVLMVNNKKRGDQYFGMGIDPKGERLYVADFGTKPQMRIFDSNFKEVKLTKDQFKNPFIDGAYSKAGEFAPYNAQVLTLQRQPRVFVAYAQIEKDPKTGKLEAGEEQKGGGLGRVVVYDLEGKYIATLADHGMLNAPWGVDIAPAEGFGAFSGKLLVGNFGDGTVVAFDPATLEPIDYLKRPDGTPVAIEGLWGILFGNGESLGEKNQLYFAAGPNDETDGIFGKLTVASGASENHPTVK